MSHAYRVHALLLALVLPAAACSTDQANPTEDSSSTERLADAAQRGPGSSSRASAAITSGSTSRAAPRTSSSPSSCRSSAPTESPSSAPTASRFPPASPSPSPVPATSSHSGRPRCRRYRRSCSVPMEPRPSTVSSTTPWPLVTNCTPSLMGPAVPWSTRRPWPSRGGSASTAGRGGSRMRAAAPGAGVRQSRGGEECLSHAWCDRVLGRREGKRRRIASCRCSGAPIPITHHPGDHDAFMLGRTCSRHGARSPRHCRDRCCAAGHSLRDHGCAKRSPPFRRVAPSRCFDPPAPPWAVWRHRR